MRRTVAFLMVAWFTIGCGFVSTDPGERVVFTTWGKVEPKCYAEGFYWYNPWSQDAYELDVRLQRLTVHMLSDTLAQKEKVSHNYRGAGSKDLQDVYLNIIVNYTIDPTECYLVIEKIGPAFVATLMEPAIVESTKAAVGRLVAEEMIQKRMQLKDDIEADLKARLKDWRIVVHEVSIAGIDFNPEYAQAIERKQIEQQKVLQAEYVRQQKEKEGQQQVALARGAADSLVLEATADAKARILRGEAEARANQLVRQSLSEELIRFETLKRWNGELPTVTGGVVPFINVDALRKKE